MNVEINCTLMCNKKCWACNRLCNVYPYTKKDEVSTEQIRSFLQQAKVMGGVKKVKLLGGEPLMCSNFNEIYMLLYQAQKDKIIQQLKVDTNHTIPFPKELPTDGVRIMGKSESRKKHIPIVHPLDEGYTTKAMPNCAMLRRCGMSLDASGWLPCSAAIPIERLWRFGSYRPTMQKEPWDLDLLCPCCPWSMSQEWINSHTYHLDQHPKEYDKPSPRYMEKLDALRLRR